MVFQPTDGSDRCEETAPKQRRYHLLMTKFAGIIVFSLLHISYILHQNDLSSVMSLRQTAIDTPYGLTTTASLSSSNDKQSSSHSEISRNIQGFCHAPTDPNAQRKSSSYPGNHPKFLFGIPSTLSSEVEKERRQLIRDTYLNFDRQIYEMAMKDNKSVTASSRLPLNRSRVCSLQEWTCNYHQIHEECQIIYAFVVGDNATAPPYILDESMTDFRSMLTKSSNDEAATNEPGLVRLNIRENQFDGKMTTWFQFAALVGDEFPEIDYTVKVDSDTLVFTPNFLENLETRHWKLLNERKSVATERIYGGIKYPKTFCGKDETHHACPLPLVGDTYMSGELNFMSMDLAKYIASDACPRNSITIPHEDVSLSNYVYSYTNNSNLPGYIQDTTIDRIFVHQERVLLTFNESADWESRKAGRSVNLKAQFRNFLWGHCNPRPMKNDALYTYFKDPKKVKKIWNEFIHFYYDGIYGQTGVEAIKNRRADAAPELIGPSEVQEQVLSKREETEEGTDASCAIMFFGLPRSFKRYVLSSIIRNVVVPNQRYGCDYYVHYYQIDREEASRSGHAGEINANDMLLLKTAITQLYNQTLAENGNKIERTLPQISFTTDTNESFWKARSHQVEKYRNTKRANGNYMYFPYQEQNYVYPTTMDNIVKQWHSLEGAWGEMEQNAKRLNKRYERVAMLRSDVIFVDPIDIYQLNNGTHDSRNDFVIIPAWSGWPVNDRMVSGPYDAVKVWATERFSRLDKYVQTNIMAKAGYGMHPEKFLNGEILPYITKSLNHHLDKTKKFCFVRVRADGGIWINDCNKDFPENTASVTFERDLLPMDVTCERRKFREWADQLYCNFTEPDDLLWNLREKPIKQITRDYGQGSKTITT